MSGDSFSFSRVGAVLAKEFVQMRRDRLTFAMMVAIPIMQLLLFGYAINTDPRHLPTLVEMGDAGPASRAIIHAMENSRYFDIRGTVTRAEGEAALKNGGATSLNSSSTPTRPIPSRPVRVRGRCLKSFSRR
jgi:ABC-2 type transport system permease protein